MEIRKKTLLCYLTAFVLFGGNNSGNFPIIGPLINILNNVFVGYYILNWLNRYFKYGVYPKVSKISIMWMLYNVLYWCCIYKVSGTVPMGDFLFTVKSVFAVFWLDETIQNDLEDLFGPILLAFVTWVVWDSVITFIYPGGMPILNNGYPLGWKNNKDTHLIISNLVIAYKYFACDSKKQKQKIWIWWFLFVVLCIINVSIAKSSTTLFAVVLIFGFSIFYKVINSTVLVKWWFPQTLYIILFVVLMFVRNRYQIQINAVTQVLFGKDATFTGRTYVWDAALLKIAESPIWGYGNYGFFPATNDDGYYYMWGIAHNAFLEFMMRGGMILLTVGIVTMCICVNSLRKSDNNNFAKVATFALLAYSFVLMFECGEHYFWVLLVIYYGGQIKTLLRRKNLIQEGDGGE